MAFFTGWASKIGSAVVACIPGLNGVVLTKADGSADLWAADDSNAGAAKVSITAAALPSGAATAARQDTLSAKVPAMGTAPMSAATPVTIATDDTLLSAMSAKLPASLGAKAKAASLSMCIATDSLLAPPTIATAITASDAIDLTALASIGITIGTGGSLAFKLVGAQNTTITLAVQSGQFLYGQFYRVMAATTATGIVGWAP